MRPQREPLTLAIVGVLLVMGPQSLASLELGAHVKGDMLVLVNIVMWGLFTVFGMISAGTVSCSGLLYSLWRQCTPLTVSWVLSMAFLRLSS